VEQQLCFGGSAIGEKEVQGEEEEEEEEEPRSIMMLLRQSRQLVKFQCAEKRTKT
jgi:hypothetical protein